MQVDNKHKELDTTVISFSKEITVSGEEFIVQNDKMINFTNSEGIKYFNSEGMKYFYLEEMKYS